MIPAFLSAHGILDLAIEKERRRRIFYAIASELGTNADMKALFHFLAEEEDRHIDIFLQIRNSLSAETEEENWGDKSAYLDAIHDDRLYSKMDSREFVQLAVDNWNAFRLAIGFEKDAILFFTEFLPHLSEENSRIVRGLIAEEKGHIQRLVEVMEQIGE